MKKKYWLGIVLGCICLGIVSFYIGNYFSGGTMLGESNTDIETLQVQVAPLLHEEQYDDIILGSVDPQQERIRRNTRLIFEHYNEFDGSISRAETVVPNFLIGMDREALTRYYSDFKIGYFSDDEIVMRRYILRPVVENFTLGIVDGYLAVFNGTEMREEYLREITSTLVAPLASDDRERLQQGIIVRGEEGLLNVLQDYSS